MKLTILAVAVSMMTASAAFAQSSGAPLNPNANPNNCSAAFPNCTGVNKTPGNSPGTARNTERQEGKIPQTARNPNLPMKEHPCPADEANCTNCPSDEQHCSANSVVPDTDTTPRR